MEHKIFAVHDETTIRVYQAYGDAIANEAVRLGNFGESFKMTRMTWIKPSFLWMMYRSGWAAKERQTRVLAIDIKREGFDYIVKTAVASTFSKRAFETKAHWQVELAKSNIRVQWDPERDIYGNPLEQRTIQLGLKGDAVYKYVHDWIVNITDITQDVIDIRQAITEKRFSNDMLPTELEYSCESISKDG